MWLKSVCTTEETIAKVYQQLAAWKPWCNVVYIDGALAARNRETNLKSTWKLPPCLPAFIVWGGAVQFPRGENSSVVISDDQWWPVMTSDGPCVLHYQTAGQEMLTGAIVAWLLGSNMAFWLDLRPVPQEKKSHVWCYNLVKIPWLWWSQVLGWN